MNRRDFLRSAFGVACAAALPRLTLAQSPKSAGPPFRATDRVFLGPRKIACSRLFLGTGSNGSGGRSDQTRGMSVEGLAQYLRDGCDAGLTSWDSADQYGSHPHLARALADGAPREKLTILTKTHAATAEQMRADIERYRRELGVDHIDILLLHCMEDPAWNRKRRAAMDVVDEYQQRGIIGSKGVSCHSFEALKTAAREPWVEIDLARINPHGSFMDARPAEVIAVLRDMKAAGKGVIGMKIFGAGELADRMDECLRFALNLDCVDAVTIGCTSAAQRDDVVARIALTPRVTA